ncbi:centrosome-associated protein CEP250-like [Calonectris borealis]|uniref:centrosome-associated protein CEP250-like n=1 Tax=Calonectris borealis TaxID=1323832 RepID=UPI003F4B63A9
MEVRENLCENLAAVNAVLREHLDKANEVNLALREGVEKLMVDWMRAQEELELKEGEWHNERERFVRAEGRANEAFWIYTCKLLPPKLWDTALGVRHSG